MPNCICITQNGSQCTRLAVMGNKCTQHNKNHCPPVMNDNVAEFSGSILRINENKSFINKVEFNVRTLREMQQKRLMTFPGVKSYKNKFRLTIGGYKCPKCNLEKENLTCAHVGVKIKDGIRKIVIDNGEKLNWDTFELFELVKDLEDKSTITICCAMCNKSLEN